VEEEIPLHEEHARNNSTATMEEDLATYSTATKDFFISTMEEDPRTNWDECWKEDDVEENDQSTPNSCSLMEYHLVLIFEI
jgi:hypothetical protein